MNIIDVSCAIAFDKNLKGPLDKFVKLKDCFRVKKWAFGIASSATQHVGGMRQHGGRITRTPLIVILPDENATDISAAAFSHAALGETKIVIAHNRNKGERVAHVELELEDTTITSCHTISGDNLKNIAVEELGSKLLDKEFDFCKYMIDTCRTRARTPSKHNVGGTYTVITIDYTCIKYIYHHINFKGDSTGKSAYSYKAHR